MILHDFFSVKNSTLPLTQVYLQSTYTYNRAGQVTTQTNTRGQDLRYRYDEAGHLLEINDWRSGYHYSTQSFRYNLTGQQSFEQYTQRNGDGSASQTYSTTTLYDAAGRIASVTSQDGSTLRYRYDANNNRRAIILDSRDLNETAWFKDGNINNRVQSNIDITKLGTASYQHAENWYTYDYANRAIISQGNLVNGQIVLGDNKGQQNSYDNFGFGRRLSVTTQKGGTESYGYDNAGRLISTSKDGKSVEQRIYDLAGRMVGQRNYNNEGNLEQSQKIHYNNIGQQTQQYYYNGSNTQTAKVRFQLDAEGNNLSHLQHGYGEDGIYISTATYYRHEYQKYDTYKEWRTTASTIWYQNNLPITWGQTRYSLDNTGNTLAVSVHNDLNKAQALVVDSLGRIRQKVAGIDIAADYEGQIQGTLAQTNTMRSSSFEQIPGGTDSYGQSTSAGLALKADTRLRSQHFLYAPNNSPIADYGRITPQANFGYMDTGVTDNVSNTQGQYTINLGDSLISIAQQIYGDASLWYLLADANRLVGIDPNQKAQIGGVLTDANGATIGTTLSPGQVLILPNKPINLSNNSSTFKTYNPASIIGDTSPTIPSPPPPKQCGKIGQIIMIVVAIIVTVVLAYYAPSTLTWWGGVVKAMLIGAAASLASQAVGVMIGAIDKINWKQVAIAGVAAGVTAGVGNLGNAWVFGSTTATAMANAAISSALTQGINIMTGQQQRFNWRSVATAAVAAGAMDAIGLDGNKVGKEAKDGNGNLVFDEAGKQVFSSSVTNWGERAVYWFGSSFVNTASEYLVNRISNAPDDQRRNFGRSWGNGIVSAASADIAHSIGDAYAADKKYINPNDPNDQGYHTAGGILKHYLSHALLGGARAALMGDSFGSGALGGLTQAVIGDLVPDEFVKGTGGIGLNADGKRDTSGDWVDRFLRQSSSTVVGLSASWLAEEVGGDGAAAQGAAQNGWENNRQLHDNEIALSKKHARTIARHLKISEEEAIARIQRQMLRWVDNDVYQHDKGRVDEGIVSSLGMKGYDKGLDFAWDYRGYYAEHGAEFYNPQLYQDNISKYSPLLTKVDVGLTQEQITARNDRAGAPVAKGLAIAFATYVAGPYLAATGRGVLAFARNPIAYTLAEPLKVAATTEAIACSLADGCPVNSVLDDVPSALASKYRKIPQSKEPVKGYRIHGGSVERAELELLEYKGLKKTVEAKAKYPIKVTTDKSGTIHYSYGREGDSHFLTASVRPDGSL